MKQLILHIGYPKTATTALQKSIFSQLQGDAWEVISPEQRDGVISNLEMKRVLQGDLPALQEQVRSSTKNWFISIEGLVFDCIRDMCDGRRFRPRSWELTLKAIDEFYRANGFDDIRILVWLRAQDELLHSVYAQSFTNFFSNISDFDSVSKYIKRILTASSSRDPLVFAYHFSNILVPIIDLYGRNRLNVMFYEEIEANAGREIEKLGSLIGFHFENRLERTNVRRLGEDIKMTRPSTLWDILLGVKKRYLGWLKLPVGLKRLLGNLSAKVVFGDPKQVSLTATDRKLIMAAFSEDNRELGVRLGLELPEKYVP